MNKAGLSPVVGRRIVQRRIAFTIFCLVLANIVAGCTTETGDQLHSNIDSSRPTSTSNQTEPQSLKESKGDPASQTFLESLATKDALFSWSLYLEATSGGGLYVPKVDDFKLPYSSHKVAQDKQAWEEYAAWIRKFYDGTFFITGWDKQAKERIGNLKSDEVYRYFNVIGRVIAAEWAKGNAIRKISTSDLYTFASSLTATATEDELLEQLQKLAKLVQRKLSE